MASEAATYLYEVLDYTQLYVLRSEMMDWQAIRSEALACIQGTPTTAITAKHCELEHSFFSL